MYKSHKLKNNYMTITTKYNVGDLVFCKNGCMDNILTIEIYIRKKNKIVSYTLENTYDKFREDELFQTKEELLKSL